MADFCKQCSIAGFGEDYGDLAGLNVDADGKAWPYTVVLCEGCGPIQVNPEGVCVSCDCLEHGHGVPCSD